MHLQAGGNVMAAAISGLQLAFIIGVGIYVVFVMWSANLQHKTKQNLEKTKQLLDEIKQLHEDL
jgi:uncharacterized membrane-anchored protein YhcB (DUF1043 family)